MIKKITIDDINIVNKLLQNIDENEIVSSDSLEHPFLKYIGYEINDEIVAILRYSVIYDRMEIDYIYVIPEQQKKGIGTKLLEYVIEESTSKKKFNITLEVRKTNIAARKLYEKMNFKKILIRKNYYGSEDAIVYMRGEYHEG
ncbi:MAG: GNAT family N-acetyltransferase [Bacilli bacterium]|nr:GNAT family N-acetyltransferase [Bacilli bacterium]MDD4282189.1 GNAT family N-acetyltransferase [Bacilli bacterium]